MAPATVYPEPVSPEIAQRESNDALVALVAPADAEGEAGNSQGTTSPSPQKVQKEPSTPLRASEKERVLCAGSAFAKKERMRCLFCGGEQCRRCGATAHTTQSSPAIKGLHSTWINDSICAMQRPSDALLKAGALESLTSQGVTAIFNLTEPGEHPYCGFGVLESSGFPYSPELCMSSGSE
jgi:hypothetical protein